MAQSLMAKGHIAVLQYYLESFATRGNPYCGLESFCLASY